MTIIATALEARERYQKNARFHAQAQAAAYAVLSEHCERFPQAAQRQIHDLALDVAARVIETVFKNDTELQAQRQIVDEFAKAMKLHISLTPPTRVPVSANWLSRDTLPSEERLNHLDRQTLLDDGAEGGA
ncbi:MAG: hypothetical protein DI570_09330 [Phenylobacterium zucineum]|nr:MAG: hypothetical protein DI570_09330 [Phenylobacterium zucineum]